MQLHEEGRSIAEIAEAFNLSDTTVYAHLGKIAERYGVTRDSLLEKPIRADHSGRNFTPVKPIDRSEFNKEAARAAELVTKLGHKILQTIEESELIDAIYEEEQ